jgi:nucleotide-binding universal stress UspA family protein
MFKHILIATDGSPVSKRAAKAGVALASRLGARITACSVVEMPPEIAYAGISMDAKMIARIEKQGRVAVQMQVEAIAAMAISARVPCTSIVATASPIFKAIISTAKKRGCDSIVLGSHGRRGFSKLILGSVTQQVLAHTTLPVLVFR